MQRRPRTFRDILHKLHVFAIEGLFNFSRAERRGVPRGLFCTDWRLVPRAALAAVREVFFAEERAEGCEGRGGGEAREERVAGHTREGPGEHRGEAAAA